MSYNIIYTTRGTKCIYPIKEYEKLSDKEKESIEKLCKNLKAKLIIM